MVELVQGFWVQTEDIKAVKRISDKTCTIWVAGIEPIVVSCAAEEVLSELGHFFPDDDEEDVIDDAGGEGDDD